MAVVLVSASFLLRFLLVQHFGEQLPPFIKQLPPFIICYPIVMLVALLAGLGPGLLATALGVLGTAFFIMSPNGSFAVANSFQAVALVLFAGTGVFMSLVAARYRQSQQLVTAYRERRARQEGKVLYRTLFNTMDEGFCIIEMIFDAAGKAVDYRFLEVNSVFEQQTSLRDTVGRRVRDLAPSIEDFWIETYGEVALTGEPVHSSMNRRFWIATSKPAPIVSASRPCGRLQWSLAISLSAGESRAPCGKARRV
jgi:PAS domain-containing protein